MCIFRYKIGFEVLIPPATSKPMDRHLRSPRVENTQPEGWVFSMVGHN